MMSITQLTTVDESYRMKLAALTDTRNLWIAAILTFGVGDAVTTLFGISVGATESNAVPAYLLDSHGALALVLMKVLSLGILYVLSVLPSYFEDPRGGYMKPIVPGFMTLFGLAVLANNTVVIATVLF